MENFSSLEASYQKYVHNLEQWLPEGIINIDLMMLHSYGILDNADQSTQDPLSRYFHVMETEEKITLVNNQFVIWIIPENANNTPTTYTLIATYSQDKAPHLELAFATAGAYNTSRMVLRILEKFLHEIQENEDMIKKYQQAS